jgi:hypothetical protein
VGIETFSFDMVLWGGKTRIRGKLHFVSNFNISSFFLSNFNVFSYFSLIFCRCLVGNLWQKSNRLTKNCHSIA